MRLTKNAFQTSLANSSRLTKQTCKQGCRIPFWRKPKLTRRDVAVSRGLHSEDDRELQQKWEALVKSGHATRITDNSHGCHSRSFTIPKKEKSERRLINDLRGLNQCVRHTKKKLHGLKHALGNLAERDWPFTFDAKDGYYNVPVDPAHRKHFRFNVGALTHELKCLPVGCMGSAEAFQAWLRPHMETLRTLFPQVTVFDHVDDVLGSAPKMPRHQARDLMNDARATTKLLGLPIKTKKSFWDPSHQVEHLGFIANTKNMMASVPNKKARAVRAQMRQTLRRDASGKLRLQHLATTMGQTTASLPACPEARLHSAWLHRLQAKVVSSHGWRARTRVRLSTTTKAELHWWQTFLQAQRLRPMEAKFRCAEPSVTATDASSHQIAGVLLTDPSFPCFSIPSSRRQKRLHINVKEMMAVCKAVACFDRRLRGTPLNIRTDSMTVVHAINRWGTKQDGIRPLLRQLFEWALLTETKVTATHVPTGGNTFADNLTLGKAITSETRQEMALFMQSMRTAQRRNLHWKMQPAALRATLRALKTRPTGTLLASTNGQSEPTPEHCLHQSVWRKKQGRLVTFPDLNKIERMLTAVETCKLDVIATLPLWPAAPWFHRAAQLSAGSPALVPVGGVTPCNQRHPSRSSWRWIGVRPSGARNDRRAHRRRLRSTAASRLALRNFTEQDGGNHETSSRTRRHLARCVRRALLAKH